MTFKLPPPPQSNDIKGHAWQDWFFKLGASLIAAASTAWSSINFSGSNLTDIATRNHNDLQNIQGGAAADYQHLTTAQLSKVDTINAGPAFSAVPSGAQSLTSGVFAKLAFQTELFDTNSTFDSATNYRFTPNVEGYYQINGSMYINSTAYYVRVAIYKNGSAEKYGGFISVSSVGTAVTVSALVYLNGSTDYVELYGAASGITPVTGTPGTDFQGFLARGV